MNPELITRLVKLVERTGDRVILPDLESGKAVVVMDLDAYERICAPAGHEQDAAIKDVPPVKDEAPVEQLVAETPQTPRSAEENKAVSFGGSALAHALRARGEEEGPNKAEDKAKTRGLGDLTQAELLDRINRDIDDWKNAQDVKRTEVLQSAAQDLPDPVVNSQLEEEERFFLEPIE